MEEFSATTPNVLTSGSKRKIDSRFQEGEQPAKRVSGIMADSASNKSVPGADGDRGPLNDPTSSQQQSASSAAVSTTAEPPTDGLSGAGPKLGGSEPELGGSDSTPDIDSDDSSLGSGDPNETLWLPVAGPMSWVQRQMSSGRDPREILSELLPADTLIPDDVHDVTLWKVIVSMLSEPPRRQKLTTVNTIEDVVQLLQKSSNVIILTGAGVSVSCGIPDFRSRDGLYARLAVEYPDLPDPQAMFDIGYFTRNPHPFFKFAKEIFPGKFEPSPSHRFIRQVEVHSKLLRNYTQNIDTLEQVADIQNVIQCHGSFATATCMTCDAKVGCADIKEDIMNSVIPTCKVCPPDAEMPIIKPDIVFFGESLPPEFHNQITEDKEQCDLLIVIGSSLKVRPVSLIPSSLPASVPQILINRESLPHQTFDIELLGDCDVITTELSRRLGWVDDAKPLRQISVDELKPLTPSPMSLPSFGSLPVESKPSSDMETSQMTGSTQNPFEDCTDPMSLDDSPARPTSPGPSLSFNQSPAPSQSASHSRVSPYRLPSSEASTNQTAPHSSVSTNSNLNKKNGPSSPSFFGKLDSKPSTSQATEDVSKPAIRPKDLASRLPDDTFLMIEPGRYAFRGAELHENTTPDSSDCDDNDNDNDDNMSNPSADEDNVDEPEDQSNNQSDTDANISHDQSNDGDQADGQTEQTSIQTEALRQSTSFIAHDEDATDGFQATSSSTTASLGFTFASQGHQDESMASVRSDTHHSFPDSIMMSQDARHGHRTTRFSSNTN